MFGHFEATKMTAAFSGRAVFKRRSLVEQVADSLRAAIRNGSLTEHLPPERKLCQLLKTSRPVVRRALHCLREEGLLHITRGHAATIIGRSIKTAARPAGRKVMLLFGETIDSSSQWPLAVIDEIRRELYERGLGFDVVLEPRLNRKNPQRLLQNLVDNDHAECWILAGLSLVVQEWFQARRFKVIMMGNPFPSIRFPFVNADLRGVTRHATGVFLGLGHRDIVFLRRERGTAGEMAEDAGFIEASRGVKGVSCSIVRHSARVGEIRRHLKILFSQDRRVTALLVSHAMDMLVVITWLLEMGIRVPQDVSIISFQWESFLERIRPMPAWYYTDPKEHARKICRLVASPDQKKRRQNLIIPSFIKNGAVGPPGKRREELGSSARNILFPSAFSAK